MKNENDYNKLLSLRDKINNKTATFSEQKEYVRMLTDEGKLTEEQYNMFAKKDKLQNDILNAALTIGGVILMAWLVNKMIENK